jgi:ATP-binding cassette subfamily C protein CydD
MVWLTLANNLYKSVTKVKKATKSRLYFCLVVTLPCPKLITTPAKRAMNKTRQQELTRWLKQQSIISRRWLMISRAWASLAAADRCPGLVPGADPSSHDYGKYSRDGAAAALYVLVLIFVLRAWVVWLRERVGFQAGQHIRYEIRRQVLDRLQQAGPAWIQGKPAGSWATLILEQIDDMHDYYARYLPQMTLAAVPLLIVITIFPINWAAALILLAPPR